MLIGHRLWHRTLRGFFLLAYVTWFLPSAGASQHAYYLTISAGGIPVSGGSPETLRYLAGSTAQFLITVHRQDGRPVLVDTYTGRRAEWPANLRLDVASQGGAIHPEWLAEMNITPYVPWMEIIADSLWRSAGQPVPDEVKTEHYDFTFTIPLSAAGSTISLSADFDHKRYGLIRTDKPASMTVIAASSNEQRDSVWDSEIWYAKQSGSYERAMALADSFIALGYTGLRGLDGAQRAALISGHYDAALRYMDLSMAANGAYHISKGSDWLEPGGQTMNKEELMRMRRAANQAEYLRLRNEYLRKIAEQQQR